MTRASFVRSESMLLKKSPRRSRGIGIRNNRIGENGYLNQRCVLAPDLESILRARMGKILFQQHRQEPNIDRAALSDSNRPPVSLIDLDLPFDARVQAANVVVCARLRDGQLRALARRQDWRLQRLTRDHHPRRRGIGVNPHRSFALLKKSPARWPGFLIVCCKTWVVKRVLRYRAPRPAAAPPAGAVRPEPADEPRLLSMPGMSSFGTQPLPLAFGVMLGAHVTAV